jgi:hypothetical protein
MRVVSGYTCVGTETNKEDCTFENKGCLQCDPATQYTDIESRSCIPCGFDCPDGFYSSACGPASATSTRLSERGCFPCTYDGSFPRSAHPPSQNSATEITKGWNGRTAKHIARSVYRARRGPRRQWVVSTLVRPRARILPGCRLRRWHKTVQVVVFGLHPAVAQLVRRWQQSGKPPCFDCPA